MENNNNKIQLIGAPCGHHGPYTFYKAFKYHKNGRHKILALSDFFFVKLWSDSDLMSIGELQLLWIDKNSEQVLASLRLYFLPENTPEGRSDDHGEDEVLAISEKVVLRVADLLDWITEEAQWGRGLTAVWNKECPGAPSSDAATASAAAMLVDSALDFQDVLKEKQTLDDADPDRAAVVVLSFPRYCRYRGIMKRLEGVTNKWLHNALVMALGGFAVPSRNTRILFCKDTFDYPDLEGHEQLCNHLAPNLKGRPRRKRKKRSLSPGGSESNESESSLSTVSSSVKSKQQQQPQQQQQQQPHQQQSQGAQQHAVTSKNGLRCNLAQPRKNNLVQARKSSRVSVSPEEKDFLVKLHTFMKTRRTPIARVPHLGFKEIDLYAFFSKVQKLGGYNYVTANRLWKPIYDELGGHQGSTSAATYTRRHYERLLLPYERSVRGEKIKAHPCGYRNHLKLKSSKQDEKKPSTKTNNTVANMKSTSPTATTKSSNPAPTPKANSSVTSSVKASSTKVSSPQQPSAPRASDSSAQKEKSSAAEGKPSSLRSVRTKVERSQEIPNGLPPPGKENIPVPNVSEGTPDAPQETSSEDISESKPVPEIIDLVSDDSPVKMCKTPVPAVKKRKLDILKEGGLEVTAITTLGPATVVERRPSVIQHAAPIQPVDNQVSITVTPDVSHIIGSPTTDLATLPSPVLSYDGPNQHTVINVQDFKASMFPTSDPLLAARCLRSGVKTDNWIPPKVVQSRSIYSHSETTVYGNPKEDIEVVRPLCTNRDSAKSAPLFGDEVLDLRVKCSQKPVVTVSRVPSLTTIHGAPKSSPRTFPKPSSGGTTIPIFGGRAVVGSNLEITVVDVPKCTSSSVQQRNQQQKQSQVHPVRKSSLGKMVSSRSSPRNENGKFSHPYSNQSPPRNNSQLIVPNPYLSSSAGGRNGSNDTLRARLQQNSAASLTTLPNNSAVPPFLPGGGSSLFPGFLPQVTGAGSAPKAGPPYLPLLDPMYYPSLYNSHGLYPPALSAAGFVSPLQASPPLFPPSAEQLQLYKELMSQHHSNNIRYTPQNAGPFLGLPRDGSTSITPVGHSTNPSSK